ncbi:MAG: hypothetical protein ACYS8W_09135 [Planctomycetota bacterium]
MKYSALAFVIAAVAAFALTGCTDTGSEPKPAADAGHEHSESCNHGAVEVMPDDGSDDHKGEKHFLGAVTVGEYEISVNQFGEAKAGGETVFEVELESDNAPSRVRVWVGTADAKGSIKCLAKKDSDGMCFDAHVELPDPLPEKSKLWIETENKEKKKVRASIEGKF